MSRDRHLAGRAIREPHDLLHADDLMLREARHAKGHHHRMD